MRFVPRIYWKYRVFRRASQIAAGGRHALSDRKMQSQDLPPHVMREHTNSRICGQFVAELDDAVSLQVGQLPKFLPKATKEAFTYNGSFHQAVGRVLLVAEFFALMPVKGITAPHPGQLSFSWYNLRTIYSFIFTVTALLDLGLCMYHMLKGVISFNTLEPFIFRISIVLVCISALSLARKWPALMVYWSTIESDLPPYQTQYQKRELAQRIQLVTFVLMMLSLGEHLMSIISTVYSSLSCPWTMDPFENFLRLANAELFQVFAYTPWLAWLAKLLNVLSTFIWNYMDVFVMIISIGLTAKFKQLNADLLRFKGLQMPATYWSARRIQYRNLCMLCEKMDNAIAVITMVSFSNNLYFICVQLLKSLNKLPPFVHAMYFYYSLFFLLCRTLAVSLYTAAVNDESRKPLLVLRCVPRESWCGEVKRFADEVTNELVALSGMKFFHLTRKLVLSVAGTIVTYELVLIQFHEDTQIYNCTSIVA